MSPKELAEAVNKTAYVCHYFSPGCREKQRLLNNPCFWGVVREAGTAKARKTGNFAKSDWMEIEKKRGNLCYLICYAI